MKTLFRLSIKSTLTAGFGIIILAILITLATTHLSLKRITKTAQEQIFSLQMAQSLTDLRADANYLNSVMTGLAMVPDIASKQQLEIMVVESYNDLREQATSVLDSLSSRPQYRGLIDRLRQDLTEMETIYQTAIQLTHEGISEPLVSFTFEKQTPFFQKFRENMLQIEDEFETIVVSTIQETKSSYRNQTIITWIMALSLILVVLGMLVFIFRVFRSLYTEINNSLGVLSSSSDNMLGMITEISTGAAETTTAISETTTTVEEVRQAAMLSNEKSSELLEKSRKVGNSLEKGQESLIQVTDAMKRIDQQMNVISDTITRLAEQNRSIGEITSTVTDIADQSNLLAVNAAIEAAKAGDHGRGFAVVAQEIRRLAEQSKASTAQVKHILDEIQKSVQKAVEVTEQGSKTVKEGDMLVNKSGEIIQFLAENIEETTHSSIQISSSSQQQMAGMEQIVPAMENIRHASEQNLVGINQAQSATQELNKVGRNLKTIMQSFNI